ncbi:MAG: ATP-binding protein [Betaproteobacteria bacterium]|jgi:hypothetical protein|nr:ATP-binding protein [Betaproteobacteria bacterium]
MKPASPKRPNTKAWRSDLQAALKKLHAAHPLRSAFANDERTLRTLEKALRWNNDGSGHNHQCWEPAQFARLFTHNKADALVCMLREHLPHLMPPPKDTWQQNAPAIQAWLDALVAAVGKAVAQDAGPTATRLPHPEWRRCARPELQRAVQERLGGHGVAVIVGMSGTGKSFLAHCLLDELQATGDPDAVLRLTAPARTDGREPSEADFDNLERTIYHWLRGWIKPGRFATTTLESAHGALTARSGAIKRCYDWHKGRQEEAEAAWSKLKTADTDLPRLLDDLVARARERELVLVSIQALVALLHQRRAGASPLHLLIDDLWAPRAAWPLLASLAPPPKAQAATWPLRVIVTSQLLEVAWFGHGRGTAEQLARCVKLDEEAREPERFARDVIAAWAAPGEDALTAQQAAAAILDFRDNTLVRHSALATMDAVAKEVNWHPLTLAAIAALWRHRGYDPKVWQDILAALQRRGPVVLRLKEAAGAPATGGTVNPRHEDILGALLAVVGTLPENDRQRYFDLALQRQRQGRRALALRLFDYLWRRVPRGGHLLSFATHTEPLIESRFAGLMLVQRQGNDYVLHDMLRLAIERALEAGMRTAATPPLAERHRELLEAAGLLGDDGNIRLDEDLDFALDAGVPGIVCSERTRLHLRLRPEPNTGSSPSEDERRAISDYFLDELVHHARAVAALGEPMASAERRVLTCFSFLQAQLDCERPLP